MLKTLINLSEITNSGSYIASTPIPSDQKFDYFFRVKEDDTKPGHYEIAFAETKTISYPFVNLIHENYILRTILRNQWRIYRYCLEYNNFLLGNYTNEDFLNIARQYAQPFLRLTDKQIFEVTSIILGIIEETLTSGEISQLINVDPADIEKVLKEYHHDKILQLEE